MLNLKQRMASPVSSSRSARTREAMRARATRPKRAREEHNAAQLVAGLNACRMSTSTYNANDRAVTVPRRSAHDNIAILINVDVGVAENQEAGGHSLEVPVHHQF